MKLVGKTTSLLPMILGIIGGVFGIIFGLVGGLGGKIYNVATFPLLGEFGYYVLMLSSIIGLVFGCLARTNRIGSLMQAIMGIVVALCLVLVGISQAAFPIWESTTFVLFLIGGLVGCSSQSAAVPAACTPGSGTPACANCGAAILDGAKFCPVCGAKVGRESL